MTQMKPEKKGGTTRRTLHYYWLVTKKQLPIFILGIVSTFGYVALLT